MNLYPENGFVRGLAKGAIIPALWLSLVMVMFISALCSGQRAELIVKSGHYGFISSFVFSPDGQLLASGGADGTIKLWSAGSGKQLCTLRHGRGVYSVAFSPDSQILASAGDTISFGRLQLERNCGHYKVIPIRYGQLPSVQMARRSPAQAQTTALSCGKLRAGKSCARFKINPPRWLS
jgi:hypothetical protein